MANVKMFKLLGVLLALMLIVWAIMPFIRHQTITNDIMATAIILILIAVAYLVILYNPSWAKAVFFFELFRLMSKSNKNGIKKSIRGRRCIKIINKKFSITNFSFL